MVIERSHRQMPCLTFSLTPHEAKQLWLAINQDENTTAKSIDAACLAFVKQHGLSS